MSTSDTANRMGSLFNDFLEAAKAIEERPALEAHIRDAEADRDRAKGEADFANQRLYDAAGTIADLRTKVAQLEADLARATFRETEARNSMDLVLGALKETMNNAKAAVELVEPPVPTSAPAEVTINEPFPYDRPWNPPSELPSATVSDHPNGPDGTNEQSYSTTGMFSGSPPTNPPSLSGGADAGDATQSLYGTPPDAEPVPQVDTASAYWNEPRRSEPVWSEPIPIKPYSGQPYWMKSSSMTWATWEAGGGAVPHWVDRTGPGFDSIL